MSEQLIGLILFALVATITPGPNNLMLVSSGALFGVRRTLPHVFGVMLGYISTLLAAVFGLAQVLLLYPWVMLLVKLLGSLWLCYLSGQFFLAAWRGYKRQDLTDSTKSGSQPLKFHQAFLFQWINPKSIVNSIACASAFTGVATTMWQRALVIGLVFLFFSGISSCLWVSMGGGFKKHLASPAKAVPLNISFGLLILVTVYIILSA